MHQETKTPRGCVICPSSQSWEGKKLVVSRAEGLCRLCSLLVTGSHASVSSPLEMVSLETAMFFKWHLFANITGNWNFFFSNEWERQYIRFFFFSPRASFRIQNECYLPKEGLSENLGWCEPSVIPLFPFVQCSSHWKRLSLLCWMESPVGTDHIFLYPVTLILWVSMWHSINIMCMNVIRSYSEKSYPWID